MNRDSNFKDRMPREKKHTSILQRKQKQYDTAGGVPDRFGLILSSLGNERVTQLFGGGQIQAKMDISNPGDRYERQADKIAEEMVTGIRKSTVIQQEIDKVQTLGGNGGTVPSDVEKEIKNLKGKGSTMSRPLLDFFEPRLGVDLENVRIHTGERGNALARSVNARAFTYENEIVFGKGEFQPGTMEGKKLIGHELVHTVQQGAVPMHMDGLQKKDLVQRDDNYSIRQDNLLSVETKISLYYDYARQVIYTDKELEQLKLSSRYMEEILSGVKCIGFYRYDNLPSDTFNTAWPLKHSYAYVIKPTEDQWDTIKNNMSDPRVARPLYSHFVHPFLEAAVSSLPTKINDYGYYSTTIPEYTLFGKIEEEDIILFLKKFFNPFSTGEQFDIPETLLSNADDDVMSAFLGQYFHLLMNERITEGKGIYSAAEDLLDRAGLTFLMGGNYYDPNKLAASMVDNLFSHAITLITRVILENDRSQRARACAVLQRCGETIRSIYDIQNKLKEQEAAFIESIFDCVWDLIPFGKIVENIGASVFEGIVKKGVEDILTEGVSYLKKTIKGVVTEGLSKLEKPDSISGLKNFVNNKFLDEQVIKLDVEEAGNRDIAASVAVTAFTSALDTPGNK